MAGASSTISSASDSFPSASTVASSRPGARVLATGRSGCFALPYFCLSSDMCRTVVQEIRLTQDEPALNHRDTPEPASMTGQTQTVAPGGRVIATYHRRPRQHRDQMADRRIDHQVPGICGIPVTSGAIRSSRSFYIDHRHLPHLTAVCDRDRDNQRCRPPNLPPRSECPRLGTEDVDRSGPLSVLLDSVLVVDISSITTPQEVEHVVNTLMSGLQMLRDTPFYKFGRDDLLDAGRHLETLGRALYAAQIRWVGEIEDTGTANQLSCSSTRALLRDTLRISSGDAADRIRAAKLTQPREPLSGGNIPPRIPLVGAALDNAEIGAGHVAVITKAAASWPQHLDPDTFDSAEQLLVDQAQQVDPGQLARTAQRLEGILDPDGPAPDEPDPTGRMELRLGNRNPRTRLTPFTGTLTDEAVEMFRQATTALAAPDPANIDDPRSPAARLAHAHLEVIRAFLDTGAGPSVGGQVPHVTMTVDYDTLTGQLANATLAHGGPITIRTSPQDSLRRPNPARCPQRLLQNPRCRSQPTPLPTPPSRSPHPPRQRLRLARLRPPTRNDPSPPHHQLARRRTNLPQQRGSPLPVPPPTSPFHRMDHRHRRRRPPRLHRTPLDRPASTTPPKPPSPSPTPAISRSGIGCNDGMRERSVGHSVIAVETGELSVARDLDCEGMGQARYYAGVFGVINEHLGRDRRREIPSRPPGDPGSDLRPEPAPEPPAKEP